VNKLTSIFIYVEEKNKIAKRRKLISSFKVLA